MSAERPAKSRISGKEATQVAVDMADRGPIQLVASNDATGNRNKRRRGAGVTPRRRTTPPSGLPRADPFQGGGWRWQ